MSFALSATVKIYCFVLAIGGAIMIYRSWGRATPPQLPIPSGKRAPRKFPVIARVVATDAGEALYAVTIENCTDETLYDGTIHMRWILHPGKFGLDDTHMPNDIWVPEPIQFSALGPRARMTVEVNGYDVPGKYDGPSEQSTKLSFQRSEKDGALVSADVAIPFFMEWLK